jgi:hypothetical protein
MRAAFCQVASTMEADQINGDQMASTKLRRVDHEDEQGGAGLDAGVAGHGHDRH